MIHEFYEFTNFSNFAISFSIISILSGCFTTFAQAWKNHHPICRGLQLINIFFGGTLHLDIGEDNNLEMLF